MNESFYPSVDVTLLRDYAPNKKSITWVVPNVQSVHTSSIVFLQTKNNNAQIYIGRGRCKIRRIGDFYVISYD